VTDPDIRTAGADETRAVGRVVAELCEPGDVVVVSGDLGAGKTTFVQGLAAGLGVDEPVVSPTFTLAREYHGALRLVHVDVYRLDRVQELLHLGLDDLAAEAVLVVEWGDVVADHLPADHLAVRLAAPSAGDPDQRAVALHATGPAWADRVGRVAAALTRR